MRIYRDCPRFFHQRLLVHSFRQNDHGNFYYDTLTAALRVLIPTVWRRGTTHAVKATTLAREFSCYIACRHLSINKAVLPTLPFPVASLAKETQPGSVSTVEALLGCSSSAVCLTRPCKR